jgi:hypothetical protein
MQSICKVIIKYIVLYSLKVWYFLKQKLIGRGNKFLDTMRKTVKELQNPRPCIYLIIGQYLSTAQTM